MKLTAENLYTVHTQGSYVLDYLLVFLFDLYPCINLCSVSFSCVLVSILQFPHLVPLLNWVDRLCRIPLDCMLSVLVMLVLLVFSVL